MDKTKKPFGDPERPEALWSRIHVYRIYCRLPVASRIRPPAAITFCERKTIAQSRDAGAIG